MSEENIQEQAIEQVPGTEPEQAIEQAPADTKYKAEIQGLNRKISELQNEVKKANMSAEEREAVARQEKEQLEAETKQLRRTLAIEKGLAEHGLPAEMGDRVKGDTPEEIQEDIKSLRSYLDGLVQTNMQSEINKRFAGNSPKGGATAPAMDYDEIAKVADHTERMRLYRQHGYIK